MSEEKKRFEKGVEYYIQFDNDTPLKLAESTEPIVDDDSFIRSTLTLEVKPEEGSKLEWVVTKKKFKIFAKEKDY